MSDSATPQPQPKPLRRYMRLLWDCESRALCTITEASEVEIPGSHAEHADAAACVAQWKEVEPLNSPLLHLPE